MAEHRHARAGPVGDLSVDGPSLDDPCDGLPGAGGDVLEVGIVMQHHSAMVLGDRGGQQVDHAAGR